jgi:hypothetical protein
MDERAGDGADPFADPVDAAPVAIWTLFQEGYVDEDMATAGLLAVDLGTRRAWHRQTSPGSADGMARERGELRTGHAGRVPPRRAA